MKSTYCCPVSEQFPGQWKELNVYLQIEGTGMGTRLVARRRGPAGALMRVLMVEVWKKKHAYISLPWVCLHSFQGI